MRMAVMATMMCMFSFRISDGAKERTRPFGKDYASSSLRSPPSIWQPQDSTNLKSCSYFRVEYTEVKLDC